MATMEIKAIMRVSTMVGENLVPTRNYLAKPPGELKVIHPVRTYGAGPDIFIKRLQDYYDSLDALFTERN